MKTTARGLEHQGEILTEAPAKSDLKTELAAPVAAE